MAKSIEDYINELREFNNRSTNTVSPYRGRLIFNVTHSRGTYPVKNALITVFENNTILKALTTDESGKTPPITLEAFDKKFSESPTSEQSYVTKYYDAEISADEFVTVRIENIPIYENITTLQQYDMLYKSAANGQDKQIVTLPKKQTN